jgi:hypothetical protein
MITLSACPTCLFLIIISTGGIPPSTRREEADMPTFFGSSNSFLHFTANTGSENVSVVL